eukprot:7552684-Pyramimonas_sp.AAC.1
MSCNMCAVSPGSHATYTSSRYANTDAPGGNLRLMMSYAGCSSTQNRPGIRASVCSPPSP